jgi:Alpha amylase, catalytic domain/ABC transporter substrate binding protein
MINDLWYKNAVIYCLSVGTYMDSNGDGIGDFKGLMRRLDYLHGLGVTAIWLMPFQVSPHRDDGYDVSDYYGVDPRYGTIGDFVEFTHGAKQRGIRVLIDLVVNHTSDEHPWFKQARNDPDSKYRDWYVWSKKKPPRADHGMVFPGVQKSTWSYNQEAKAWYFHRFYDFQPDLNTSHPVALEVREVQAATRTFGLEAALFEIRRGDDIAPAFEALKGRAEALYVMPDPVLFTNRLRINTLALGARLPTMHSLREYVEASGLISYGPNWVHQWRRAADYVDKILRGAKPADIPVEQPTKFDLVINLTTAKALGIEVPPTLLARADEVIE